MSNVSTEAEALTTGRMTSSELNSPTAEV
jgi:hypothetical protein